MDHRLRGHHIGTQKNEVVFDHDGRMPSPMVYHRNDKDLVISFSHYGTVPSNPMMGDMVAMFDADELVMGQGNLSYPKALAIVSVDNQTRKKTVVFKANQLTNCHGRFVFHYMHSFPTRVSLGRSNFYFIRCPSREELTKELIKIATPGDFLNEMVLLTKRHLAEQDVAYYNWRQEVITSTIESSQAIYQSLVNQVNQDMFIRISDYEKDVREKAEQIARLEIALDEKRRMQFDSVPAPPKQPLSIQVPTNFHEGSANKHFLLGGNEPCNLSSNELDTMDTYAKNIQTVISNYGKEIVWGSENGISNIVDRPGSDSLLKASNIWCMTQDEPCQQLQMMWENQRWHGGLLAGLGRDGQTMDVQVQCEKTKVPSPSTCSKKSEETIHSRAECKKVESITAPMAKLDVNAYTNKSADTGYSKQHEVSHNTSKGACCTIPTTTNETQHAGANNVFRGDISRVLTNHHNESSQNISSKGASYNIPSTANATQNATTYNVFRGDISRAANRIQFKPVCNTSQGAAGNTSNEAECDRSSGSEQFDLPTVITDECRSDDSDHIEGLEDGSSYDSDDYYTDSEGSDTSSDDSSEGDDEFTIDEDEKQNNTGEDINEDDAQEVKESEEDDQIVGAASSVAVIEANSGKPASENGSPAATTGQVVSATRPSTSSSTSSSFDMVEENGDHQTAAIDPGDLLLQQRTREQNRLFWNRFGIDIFGQNK